MSARQMFTYEMFTHELIIPRAPSHFFNDNDYQFTIVNSLFIIVNGGEKALCYTHNIHVLHYVTCVTICNILTT